MDREHASLALVVIWMRSTGELVNLSVMHARDFPDGIAPTFHDVVNGPRSLTAPARVRVPFRDLADQLRRDLPHVDVVCADTPEVDRLVPKIEPYFPELLKGADEQSTRQVLRVPSFYESAARLWEMAPWAWLPHGTIVTISAPDFGLPYGGAVFAGSRQGDDPGLLLFNHSKDAEQFVEVIDKYRTSPSAQLKNEVPAHLMLGYVREAGRPPIPVQLLEAARRAGWNIRNDSIFPWHSASAPGLERRPATVDQMWLMEIVQFAFTAMFTDTGDPAAIGHVFASGLTLQANGGRIGRVDIALPLDVMLMARDLGKPYRFN